MFKKFNEIRAQRKESGKKGFTLVELIVVLIKGLQGLFFAVIELDDGVP